MVILTMLTPLKKAILTLSLVGLLSSSVVAEGELELINKQRSRHNLYALLEDPELTTLAHERLQANIKRGRWDHYRVNGRMIGRFRPARVEGCGKVSSSSRWYTCFWNTKKYKHAGAARAKVGNRYWQLLLLR